MSSIPDQATTRIALYCYRRSSRNFLEFLIFQQLEGDRAIWLAYEADVPTGMDAAGAARQAAMRFGASAIIPMDYRYPLPLWGSSEASAQFQESGSEEVFCAEVPPGGSAGSLDDTSRWVKVMDGVAALRYPEHVEALLRVAAVAEAAVRQSA